MIYVVDGFPEIGTQRREASKRGLKKEDGMEEKTMVLARPGGVSEVGQAEGSSSVCVSLSLFLCAFLMDDATNGMGRSGGKGSWELVAVREAF